MGALTRQDRVVVIGAGIIGVSIGYHLAALGHRDVVILDRGLVGEGTTARATGAIRQQFTSAVNAKLAHLSLGKFLRLAQDTGEPFDFLQHGYLFLLTTPGQLATFTSAVAMQNELGIPSRILTPDEVGELYPQVHTDDLAGATYCATDGSASPTDAANAYAKAARRLGVVIRTRTNVTGFLTKDGGARVCGVRTEDGDVEAGLVILAAGPQSRDLAALAGVTLEVSPHRRQVFAIEGPPWLHRRLPFTVDLSSGAYLHPETDHGVIGGNDRDVAEGSDTAVDWDLLPSLLDALVHRWPGLDSARVTSAWAGLREMTPDDHALVGPVADLDGLWVATGFSGHGVMQAPAIGQAVAELLVEGHSDIDISPLRPERFAQGEAIVESGVF